MARLGAVLALLAGAQGKMITCNISAIADDKVPGSDCSDTSKYLQACYYHFSSGSAGCIPRGSADDVEPSAAGCDQNACWCMEDKCNTKEWAMNFKETYVPPPMCWTGVTGANEGPKCSESQLHKDSEYKMPECMSRSLNNRCVENNKGMGMGDGCGDGDKTTLLSCESYRAGSRRPSESFDGSDKHCRWILAITKDEMKRKCEVDDGCTFNNQSGEWKDGVPQGSCDSSKIANANSTAWNAKRGTECDSRLKFGCFENNDWMGENDKCTKQSDQAYCLAQVDGCSEGVCTGTATQGKACVNRTSSECSLDGGHGCTWKKQCCQWSPKPNDMKDACLNSGKGTMDGMCTYHDGVGPPEKDLVAAGFEHRMLTLKDRYDGKCSILASFRNDKGSAVTMGSDRPDLVSSNCKSASTWRDLAEHIGHTSATIDEYCQNFIPDKSAMATLSNYKPSIIIEAAKQGQLGVIMPGLKDLLYIVTAKPEYGECLFVADTGKYGAAVCTCEGAECNNKSKLQFIVDMDKGPMRLLQFLDGSLSDLKDEINKVVSVLDANGKINITNVGKVTKANVDAIMNVSGVSDRTNTDELWGLVQDYQKLLKAQEDYKTEVMNNSHFAAIKIDSTKVDAANKAAGCQLYRGDGIPNTFCLGSLSDDNLRAVANATGLATDILEAGSKSPSIYRPRPASCSGILDAYKGNECCGSRLETAVSYDRLHFALPGKPNEISLMCGDVKRAYQENKCCKQK